MATTLEDVAIKEICSIGDKTGTIPDSASSNSNALSYQQGFPVATAKPLSDNGIPPKRQDMNAVLNLMSKKLVYLQNGGKIKFESSTSTLINGYPKGAELSHYDSFGNIITITALKDNPSAPSSSNIYYSKSKIYVESVVTTEPTASADNYGKVYFLNGTTKKIIQCGKFDSLYLFYDFNIEDRNTIVDNNGKYYDFDGTTLTDVSTNYDWIVNYVYLQQQKSGSKWFKVWSDGIVEQGYSGIYNTSSSIAMTWLDIFIETDNTNNKVIDNYVFSRGGYGKFGGFTISNKTISGVVNYAITQIGVRTTQQDYVSWYIKGYISTIQKYNYAE